MKIILVLLLPAFLSSCSLSDTNDDFSKLDMDVKTLKIPIFKAQI
ncbi:hypothetical protein [Abyssogena phaseoliformis symbiont]|nr:hypothetical protein [Abyssogena phaseoliformis symbiont]MBW5288900.1 hypothetical protein [Candidatus Ruthia sp. Apha_13_S6]